MTTIRSEDVARDLPGVLARAAAGESFEVIDADRPVARISPPPSQEPTDEERDRAFERLAELAASLVDRLPPGHVVDDSRETIYGDREEYIP